ncbi:MAG: hypothetical protein Q4C80_03980 [Bacillota bacterium]|nr:hypothetical protein [Bacillota bacterium]
MLFKLLVALIAVGLITVLTWACSHGSPAGIGSWEDNYVNEE